MSDIGPGSSDADVRAAVDDNELWYHTMELRPGIVTPGWFDLRPIVDRMPWPDVRGKRCLDIGTYDGHLAFELERRGASEVIATDISDHAQWDWPYALRAQGPERLAQIAGTKGMGFEIAAAALGSSVKKLNISIYDLDPDRVGMFDVVVCGSLLLHLRDPIRALESVRTVCAGQFLSAEQIDAELTLLHRRQPLTQMRYIGDQLQWHVPNASAHRQMLVGAGFRIERSVRPYPIAFGVAHPPVGGGLRRRVVCRIVTGGFGVPHTAMLASPI